MGPPAPARSLIVHSSSSDQSATTRRCFLTACCPPSASLSSSPSAAAAAFAAGAAFLLRCALALLFSTGLSDALRSSSLPANRQQQNSDCRGAGSQVGPSKHTRVTQAQGIIRVQPHKATLITKITKGTSAHIHCKGAMHCRPGPPCPTQCQTCTYLPPHPTPGSFPPPPPPRCCWPRHRCPPPPSCAAACAAAPPSWLPCPCLPPACRSACRPGPPPLPPPLHHSSKKLLRWQRKLCRWIKVLLQRWPQVNCRQTACHPPVAAAAGAHAPRNSAPPHHPWPAAPASLPKPPSLPDSSSDPDPSLPDSSSSSSSESTFIISLQSIFSGWGRQL